MAKAKELAPNPAYAPFLDALHLAHKKRHIHRLTVTSSSHDARYGYFLEVHIKPHRSRDFTLGLIFSTSSRKGTPTFGRVKISTYTSDCPEHGALGDAMMLIGEIVTAWTTIAETSNP